MLFVVWIQKLVRITTELSRKSVLAKEDPGATKETKSGVQVNSLGYF